MFLKTEEKKREASRPKTTTSNPAPATPTEPAPTPLNAAPLSEAPLADLATTAPIKGEDLSGQYETTGNTPTVSGEDAVDAPTLPEQDVSSNQDQVSLDLFNTIISQAPDFIYRKLPRRRRSLIITIMMTRPVKMGPVIKPVLRRSQQMRRRRLSKPATKKPSLKRRIWKPAKTTLMSLPRE